MSLTLIIGGTRSGKSARAEALAVAGGRAVRYVATAEPTDDSMAARIAEHAARRPREWTTVEAGGSLAAALGPDDGTCALVDGLGAWLATAMHHAGAFEPLADGRVREVREQLLAEIDAVAAAARAGREVLVVAEEAGQGVLPPDAGSRAWVDLLGEAVQRLAAAAERVELVVAGQPIVLRTGGTGAEPARAAGAELRRHGDVDARNCTADHSVSVLAGGPPAWLRAELEQALAGDTAAYPDERVAIAAIAALHGRDPAEIVPTNGAAEALWLLPAALRPALAACVHPGFTEGEAALRAHGVPVARVLRDPARRFALDPFAVPADADLVLVGNPASPSGTLDPATALLALRRPGRVVVVDEAFMDLVPGEPATLVRRPLPDVIVVRSLTKSLAIPGLRAGYAVAPPALAERLRAGRPPGSANAHARAALAAAARR
ncbi:MAG: histidinol-phosphate aminotransferase, partial [Solirubrobacteraceae bacterium]|nr:histidinol-phosphate aminotransferase [Solirubrobacteraceae bacterium]